MRAQSPSVVVFRALVILTCLIAIPLAAVFGTALPDLLQKLAGQLPSINALSKNRTSGTVRPEPETAAFGATDIVPPSVSLGESAPQGGLQTASDQRAPVVGATGAWPRRPSDSAPAAVVPTSHETPVKPPPPETTADEVPRAVNPPHIDRFTYIQNRLQELGATYYLLETLGTRDSYRFYCRIAVGGNPTFIKWFEATDPDPLTAMARVLGEVETWQAGRRE